MNKMIKKIELDLGGKKVELTPTQAKNLKEALDELFGKEVIREVVRDPMPYIPYYPQPYYHYWEWYPQGYRVGGMTWGSTGQAIGTTDYVLGGSTFNPDTNTLCISA